jgi:hypothetical protein
MMMNKKCSEHSDRQISDEAALWKTEKTGDKWNWLR